MPTVHEVGRVAFAMDKFDERLQIRKDRVWAIVWSFGKSSKGVREYSFSKALAWALASGTTFSVGMHNVLHSFEEIFLKRIF